jgi:hypothetical protein
MNNNLINRKIYLFKQINVLEWKVNIVVLDILEKTDLYHSFILCIGSYMFRQ